MMARRDAVPIRFLSHEIRRRVIGSVVEIIIKMYGAAAALSVALSHAETAGGKAYDAVNAVPNLIERYNQAKYVVDHREQIRSALDYVHENAPDAQQLESAAIESAETLDRIGATYSEVAEAWESIVGIRPNNFLQNLPRAKEHFANAWAARPDLDSIDQLADRAQDVVPFLIHAQSLDIDFPLLYGQLISAMDNFASDEIGSTLAVMGAAFAVAYILGSGVGFWARRGRPGFVASWLQRRGARIFRPWYVQNPDYALGRPLYAVARERLQRDLVADPSSVLEPEALEKLELYFERQRGTRETFPPSPGSGHRVGTECDC
jgi:hypothetical protein